ncbi:MAG TPA: hypothetical protein VGP25_17190 [Gemmatimonadaceae bacterium]|jgi:uncharacterized membrane protein|nr:hypothetical protein [Gemmatimonadaceae bacterium]
MNGALLLALRLVHILAGTFWVGGVFIAGLFILPAVRAVGPAAMPVMQHIMLRRRLAVYLPISAVLSVLAGVILYGRNMSLTAGAWGRSPMGMGMTFGAASAILALVFGMGVSAPAAKKLASAAGPGGLPLSDDVRARLTRRAAVGSTGSMLFLAIATVAMAIARYL